MNTVSKHYKLILFSLIFLGSVQVGAQVWQVDQLSSTIESGVKGVNNKARAKDINGALDDLDKLNNELRRSLPEFPDWYKTAREKNKDYNFKVNAGLASQLEVQYWRNMLQKVERNKKGLNEAFSGIEAMKTLDAQDVAWSYLKTIYNAGKAIKDVVESASTGNFGGVFFNTKEGMDQFIEDYKNIENAELQGLETAQKEQELKLMISKAKAMERNYKRIEEKISSGLAVVESFNSNIESLRQLSEKLSKEAQYKIDWNDNRYNFNAQNYLQRIEQEKGRLENSYINWSAFKNSFLSIGKKAVQEKNNAVAAIQKTDDVAVKQAKLDDVEAAYEDYSKIAFETFSLLEQQYGTTVTEKINLNYQIDDFKPVPFPTGQNIDAGSAGATLRLSAVQAEADVQELINLIHAEVKGVNELANRKQMETAINRLNDLNRRFERELGFSFAANYRKAREDNPDFTVRIEAQLSGKFKGAYWENSLKQNAAKLKDLRDRYYATPKSNARRYWEITYALCKSAYDMAQLKPDVAKELKESGKKAAWDKVEESTDGIKEDFKKIEKAFQMEYNTPENKAAIEALMKKVAITAEALEGLASYMKVNEEEATRFYALVDRFNSMKKEIESGPSKLISSDDVRYNFDETTFYNRAKQLVNEFGEESLSWTEFDQKLNQLNREAEQQKDEVIRNLKASDDLESKKQQAINTETNDWDYYNSWAIAEHGKCFELNKQTQTNTGINAFAGAEETPQNNNTKANPFVGAPVENNSSNQGATSDKMKDKATPPTQNLSSGNRDSDYEKYALDKSKYLNRINNAGKQYQDGEIDRSTFLDNKWQAILNDYNLERQLLLGALRRNEEVTEAKIVWQNFSDEMQQVINSYLNGRSASNEITAFQPDKKITSNTSNQESNSVSTPPGTRIPNKLYHSWWSWDMGNRKISLKQNGNSVQIGTSGVGTIRGRSMIYNFTEEDGTTGTDTYTLIGDGYEMEVQKEWTTGRIKDKIRFSMSAPTPEKIKEFRNKNGKYENYTMSYSASMMATFNDSDSDQVPNDYDKCPNTPAGFTVQNGGVDIAGCPTGQGQAVASVPNVSQPAQNTTSSTANPFAGSSSNNNSSTSSGSASSQGANSLSTPPGKRIRNVLFHNIWEGGQRLEFRQTGNSVELPGVGTGTVAGNTLTISYKDTDGVQRTNTYTLVGDGFKMDVKKEWRDKELKTLFMIDNNFTFRQAEFDAYKKKQGKYQLLQCHYNGGIEGIMHDKDNDQVHDDYDNCPNTPAGFTVDNGGVDIAGCPTGQGQAVTSVSNVSRPAQKTTSSTPNPFAGAGETNQNKNSVPNPFAGATSGSSTSSTSKSSAQAKPNSQPKINTANNAVKTPPPSGYIGTISNTGDGKGSYCTFPVSDLKNTDRIIFHVLSGDLKKTEIIWRTEGGSWRTKYEGPQTVFKASDYLKNLPDFITHLIFTVNAQHNRNYLPNACEVEVWHLPPGANVPNNWKKINNEVADKISDDFNKLIQKADDAFNKKYWNESQGARATSNPKQESYDLLRRAEQLIGQQANITTQYAMVSRLVSKHAEYAKRVFANTAKVEFIESAGRLLAQYGGKANSLGSIKSNAYSNIAKGWEELTKAAIWGDHQYNKMYCDKESKRYYNLATN